MDGMELWKVQVDQLKVQMEQWMEQGSEIVRQIPPIQLYVGVGVLLLTTLLLLFTRLFKGRKSNTIVLSGLSGSGKTVLFYQLRDGSSHQGTVTSMEPNEGTFVLHSEIPKKDKLKPVHLIDVPGHSRLRAKLDDFLPQAAGVVFVVDALDFLPNCRAASESAISDADISNDFTLGVPGKAFSFTQCHNKVSVAEASGLTGEVSEVEQFIRENVKS
ncbi:Signal recognition particle receptor subunit beta [Cucurbita argyrosperma subsp. argyrosperma]|nr:Signal recognition particle receptor subunit beta [Cucurbita argyrosperma subsp. argyrosperma]